MPLAALNVYYRDFRFALPFGIQLWLFASPVAYPLSSSPPAVADALRRGEPRRRDLGQLHASSGVRAGARSVATWVCSILQLARIGTLGYYLFKRLEPNFADVI